MKYTPKYEITERIRADLQEIEKLRDKIRGERLLPEVEASIHLRASVESVHSSTSIEGNPLSVNEVRAVMLSEKKLTKKEYAEIEVQNYQRALDYIEKRRHGNVELELADILELHHIIMDRLLDENRVGKLRRGMVHIENQEGEVIYVAAQVGEVRSELEELIEWVRDNKFLVHPVIIAAVIHFRLAAIHPFADGNGRTARATTALFLALNQCDCNGALELNSYYAEDRKAYYAILQLVNGKNYESSRRADLTPWIEYFASGFLTSLHVLDAEIRILNLVLPEGKKAIELEREDQELLGYVAKFGSINISAAEKLLPEIGRRSLQRRLKKLVDEGYLVMEGEGREVRYGGRGR